MSIRITYKHQAHSHWNMYQLDEIPDEAHDTEADGDSLADLNEF